jgi:hypothetical protein
MIADSETRKLPIALVVRRGFLFAWESRAVLWLPYALYTAVTVLANVALLVVAGPADSPAAYAVNGAEEVFAMAFAVGIHRYVLSAEAPPGAAFFRWDRNFAHYVLMALLLFVIAILLMIIAQQAASRSSPELSLLVLVAFPLVAVSLCRLSLLLPAAALGDPVTALMLWTRTRNNGLRLLAVNLIAVAPFLVVEGLLILSDASPPGAPEPTAASVMDFLATIAIGLITPVQLIVVTIILALEYDLLVRGGGPGR